MPERMKAAVLVEPFRVEIVDKEAPRAGRGQIRMRVDQCGLCASDVDLWLGRRPDSLPAWIGHEIAGVVEEVGSGVAAISVGDRIVAWIPDGGFAEKIIVEERYCVPIAETICFPAVAEPLSCVVNAVELAAPSLGDDVVIIGAGFMGSLVQLVTALKGPHSIAVADIRSDALARAMRLGATHVVDTSSASLAQTVFDATDGRGADITFEVTGVNAGLDLAGEVTRMSGKVCIVGYHQGGTRAIPLGHWNWMAFQIVNAHFREHAEIVAGMRAGMRLVEAGLFDVSPLFTHVYALDNIGEAFEVAAAKPTGFVKAVIEP
jgi:L-iditol 2-dehydrogenase